MTRLLPLFSLVFAAALLAPGQAGATFYYELLSADAQNLDPDTRIVFESDTPVGNVWSIGQRAGAVETAPSGLGDGVLTGLAPTQFELAFTHTLEPLTPEVDIGEILSASVTLFMISDSPDAELAFVWLDGAGGTTVTGSPIPTYGFSIFEGDVSGVISITDGIVNVRAFGSTQFQLVASALEVEYTPSVGGRGGQPHMPEPSAALIFPIGLAVGGLAARRIRAARPS